MVALISVDLRYTFLMNNASFQMISNIYIK